MTQTLNNRAKVGGETGMNGEWYEGGQFLPSTMLPKGTQKKSKKGSGKQEIAPYKWVVAPADNLRSIFKQLAGVFARYNADGTFEMMASQQTLDYYEADKGKIQELIDLYNSGVMWIAV